MRVSSRVCQCLRRAFRFSSEKVADQQNKLGKEKYLYGSEVRAQVMGHGGWFHFQYFHTFLPNQNIGINQEKTMLIKVSKNPVKLSVKRHPPLADLAGGPSAYETIQEFTTMKWLNATREGNTLVEKEYEGSWFQVLGVGPYYVFQFVDPFNPTHMLQLGFDGPLGSPLKIVDSKTEFFKLIYA